MADLTPDPRPGPRLPKWAGSVLWPLLAVPMVLGIHEVEGAWFFVTAAAMCFCAPLGGMWWGEVKGQTEGSRGALGCVGTLGLFAFYALWIFVLARYLFDR